MPLRLITGTVVLVTLFALWPSFALAHEEMLRVSRVVRVVDGDSITVDFDGLPAIFGQAIGIRLSGINTPEKYASGPFCDSDLGTQLLDACHAARRNALCEREMAEDARVVLEKFVSQGTVLLLTDLKRDKYFRLNADLLIDGKSASAYMLATGHARPYSGDTARQPWVCQEGGK